MFRSGRVASAASVRRHFYARKMTRLTRVKVLKNIGGRRINVGFTKYGNDHLYSDAFGRSRSLQKGDLLKVDDLLRNSTYVRSSPVSKARKDDIVSFHYFETNLHGNRAYLNVAREERKANKGRRKIRYFVYSVTDRLR